MRSFEICTSLLSFFEVRSSSALLSRRSYDSCFFFRVEHQHKIHGDRYKEQVP
jgi:hypothetical protein